MDKIRTKIVSEIKGILSLIFTVVAYLIFGITGAAIYIAVDIITRLIEIGMEISHNVRDK